jgi:hypothetical protein
MRSAAAFAGVLAALSIAASANAGVYEVYACGGPAGAAQNAFSRAADPLMDAYSICPPASAVGTGIVTKATSGGGFARYFTGAYQIFEAPPGTSLESVTFNVGAIRLENYWSVGIVTYDGDFNVGELPYGCYYGRAGCGFGTSSFSPPVTVPLYGAYRHSKFRFETRCFNGTGCPTSASPFSPANRALFSAANVSVRVQDSTLPWIGPDHGALWSGGWHRGNEEAWATFADNIGVMVTRLYVDGQVKQQLDFRDPSLPGWARCDFTYPKPCKDFTPGGLSLDTASLPDGQHALRIEAIDAAGNLAAIDQPLAVDNTPPGKASDPFVGGGQEWRSKNGFEVHWSNPAGQVSPITGAHYEVCQPAVAGPCRTGSVAGQDVSGFTDLALPAPGDYTVRVWLEDAAGNRDRERATDPVHLRFDDEAPVLSFDSQDPADPARVSASVSDRGSGVARAELELRALGTQAWMPIASSLEDRHLAAHVDDERLPAGAYELRARASDVAGNERTFDRRPDGSKMELVLPIRVRTRIEAGVLPFRKRRKNGKSQPPGRPLKQTRVEYGTRARIAGRLLTGDGTPLRGAAVLVLEQRRSAGSRFGQVASVRTADNGGFSWLAPSGPSRNLRLRYPGTVRLRPAEDEVRLLVPAETGFRVNKRFALNGESVTFSGRLRGGLIPTGGKLIELQAFVRGSFRTFATAHTAPNGSWRYSYRFDGTRGRQVYRFRARIPRESVYPFETGTSRRAKVAVRGL